jgi:hypothetical protein
MHVAIRVAENWIVAIALLMLGWSIAFNEFVSAPYGSLRSLKPRLDVASIRAWLNNPKLAARQYTALLQSGALQDSAMRSLDTCRAAAMRSLNICRAAQVRTSRSHPERLQ